MKQKQRAVLLVYGEETEGLSIRVPKSKKQEVKSRFYEVLKEFESPVTVMVDCFEKVSCFAKENQNKTVVKSNISEFIVYEYAERVPFGTTLIDVIGHKIHYDSGKDIYYPKLLNGKVVILGSEKDVKAFIRKELIK